MTDPQTLLANAKCYLCLGITLAEALQLALLDTISTAGGSSQFAIGTTNPVAAPAITNAPAQFFNTATGFTFNWDIGSQSWIPVPKAYHALLTQTAANNPVVTVLNNTVGAIVWTRVGAGTFQATLAGAFPPLKTLVLVGAGATTDGVLGPSIAAAGSVTNANNFQILTADFAGNSVDGELLNTPVEILVFP